VHPYFNQYDRLKIFNIKDPQFKKLAQRKQPDVYINGKYYKRNTFDLVKVADIECQCPDKYLYEQVFGSPVDQPKEVMAYNSCMHTIYAAAKRQMKMAPTPEPAVADDFIEYAINIIEKEVGTYLTHFGYSYDQWYQHLTRTKQKDMDMVRTYLYGDRTLLTPQQISQIKRTNYEGICKVELQETDGKPRMVCAIPMLTKYAMGPITWALEEIFAKHFQGYCGNKNLTEMADYINNLLTLGFTKVVEGDGSAFDNTQDITLKRVDHYIYKRIVDKVFHIDRKLFLELATNIYKIMDVVTYDSKTKTKKQLFSYMILGTVFSGDCDTTLCNTIRMALYNRYVNDKAGLVYGKDYVAFSKGDDFTVLYKPYVDNTFIEKAYYKYFVKANPDPEQPDTRVYGLGQVLKMLDFGGPASIKFCSLRAWLKPNGTIILTRDPKKFYNLSKYSRKIKTLDNYAAGQYLLDQAISLMISYPELNIFKTMAQCYEQKAQEYIANIPDSLKNKLIYKYNKHKYQIETDSRLSKPEIVNIDEDNQYNVHIYNICKREHFYKIQGDYWTTMQKIEKLRTDRLTENEALYVNQQIDAEFSSEELKSVLGMTGLKINTNELKQ